MDRKCAHMQEKNLVELREKRGVLNSDTVLNVTLPISQVVRMKWQSRVRVEKLS